MAKGFNRPGGMKNKAAASGNIMAKIQQMQQQMEEAQAKLAEETITATAGGGAVKITMSGDQVCKGVEIDPALLQDADAEMLQDLILTAINLSLEKVRELQSQRMGPLAGGLGDMLPPGFGF